MDGYNFDHGSLIDGMCSGTMSFHLLLLITEIPPIFFTIDQFWSNDGVLSGAKAHCRPNPYKKGWEVSTFHPC